MATCCALSLWACPPSIIFRMLHSHESFCSSHMKLRWKKILKWSVWERQRRRERQSCKVTYVHKEMKSLQLWIQYANLRSIQIFLVKRGPNSVTPTAKIYSLKVNCLNGNWVIKNDGNQSQREFLCQTRSLFSEFLQTPKYP